MQQLTLISPYGPKPPPLLQQIQTCQEIIQHSPLGKLFRPYHPEQVHGAIVGEGLGVCSGFVWGR